MARAVFRPPHELLDCKMQGGTHVKICPEEIVSDDMCDSFFGKHRAFLLVMLPWIIIPVLARVPSVFDFGLKFQDPLQDCDEGPPAPMDWLFKGSVKVTDPMCKVTLSQALLHKAFSMLLLTEKGGQHGQLLRYRLKRTQSMFVYVLL